jgi:rod shape-determining protein MreD
MRKNLLWAAVVMLAALVQTTWPEALRVAGVLPDLTLILVVYFGIAEGEERAMFTGALGGVFQDIASNGVLGHHVFCNVLAGYLVGRMSTRLVTEHPAVKAGAVFVAALAHGLLYTLIQYIQMPSMSALQMIAAKVVPGAFYTGLATPVVFFVLDRALRRTNPIAGGAS